jgi:pimeloyl-ACP methyl ester carboxylesterase
LNGVEESERRRLFESLVPDSGLVTREFTLTGVHVDAAKVRCPVLCVVGLDDNATPARSVRSIATKYSAELREYPGHAHWFHEEPGWEEMAAGVLSWLDRHILAQDAVAKSAGRSR